HVKGTVAASAIDFDSLPHRVLLADERLRGSGLADRGRARGGLGLKQVDRGDDPSLPRCVAEAPAGHRVALGDAVDQKVPILQLWQDACEARRWARGVVDLVVDLVSQHPDAGIPRK